MSIRPGDTILVKGRGSMRVVAISGYSLGYTPAQPTTHTAVIKEQPNAETITTKTQSVPKPPSKT
jgi:hypothetical protein